ncbi:hypothetical protein PN462_20365 [Spirulina sp. CS-785/01]|uniref:hypothetical protein n=1 Tax=Spirulina sp. CS-785/01 TaxID=3021716 RepID=UPI00232C523D|nr:hypothetical protein [Spirulina sp. CS-785/01]MDB9315479.1 hypothetical protein [Spirulina sp. CS-785/01]
MNRQWQTVSGIVTAGYQVASGQSEESPYPQGSIPLQTPHFQGRGLDLGDYYPGTLNVDISPYQFSLAHPEWTFRQVQWIEGVQEDFSFSQCYLQFQGVQYPALIYYPHPETKPAHIQDPSVIEILAPPIPNIYYGDKVELVLPSPDVQIWQ